MEPCCQIASNLKPDPEQAKPGLVVNVCQVCNRRHFELTVDPGKFGLRLASIGGK